MFGTKVDRPYFQAWLRRTRRQLAASGRLTEVAMVLAREEGGTIDDWRTKLRVLLEGEQTPSLDLLMRIDTFLAGGAKRTTPPVMSTQEFLFA